MLSKRTIKFNILSKVNQTYSKYSKVLYFLKDSHKIIYEDVKNHQTSLISNYELSKILHLHETITDWYTSFTGEQFRIHNKQIQNIIVLNDSIKFNYITLIIDNSNNTKDFDTPNFKIKNINNDKIEIKYKVPFFPMYARINGNKLSQVFFKINNLYYNFPYGNTSNDNKICLGHYDKFTSKEHIYSDIITSVFNYDYAFNLKILNKYDIQQNQDFNFKECQQLIRSGKKLDLLHMLFYISNFSSEQKINLLPIDDIYVKSLKLPTGETQKL